MYLTVIRRIITLGVVVLISGIMVSSCEKLPSETPVTTQHSQIKSLDNLTNEPPVIQSITYQRDGSGQIELTVFYEDRELDSVVFNGEFSIDYQLNWQSTDFQPVASRQVVPPRAGKAILLWDSLANIDFHQQYDVYLRVTPTDSQPGEPQIVLLEGFDHLTNKPPVIQSITYQRDGSGQIELTVFYEDRELDSVVFNGEFSIDYQLNWQSTDFQPVASRQVVPPRAGKAILLWDSLADIDFHQQYDVYLRVTPTDSQAGEPQIVLLEDFDQLDIAVQRVENHTVYYGPVTPTEIAQLATYDLVILHPTASLSRETIVDIQQGLDPLDPQDDVIVLCYISIGEDGRTVNLTDEEMLEDPRFLSQPRGLVGPRVDPRGIEAYTTRLSFEGVYTQGLPSPGGTRFASWYLDDNSLAAGNADGLPDRNSVWGGAYVNIGDPHWFDVLMKMNTQDGEPAGIRQILSATEPNGLGCDGLFLDTLDAASPNSFSAEVKHEWIAPGVKVFLQKLRQAYPRAVLMQNRGLFFFHPDFLHYAYRIGEEIDLLMFESYRLDVDSSMNFNPLYFCGNKRDYAPKLIAESHRPQGFKIVSLGYAEGPPDTTTGETLQDTLLGRTQYGLVNLMSDIMETQSVMGFRHYITNRSLDLLNDFVKQRSSQIDTVAPIWSSVFNDVSCDDNIDAAVLPTPRIGVQQAITQTNGVTVRWDVAIDKNRVSYVLYYQSQPFDFSSAEPFAESVRQLLSPQVPADYAMGVNATTYPFEFTINGLLKEVTYYFLIRAIDHSVVANEETNEVVLTATPN